MFKDMVLKARADDIVEKGSAKDRLNAVYLPVVPIHVTNFFSFMQEHIRLDVVDVSMGGSISVRFRENRNGLSDLMQKAGYEYVIYQTFVDDFESKLLEQHYDSIKSK